MTRTQKWHFILLTIALLDFSAYLLWQISFRGQLVDLLLFIAPFVTAVMVLCQGVRQLKLDRKIYFIAFTVINVLISPLYVFLIFCYPLHTYASSGRFEVRECRNLLGLPAVDLIKKHILFEQDIQEYIQIDLYGNPRLTFQPDSVGLIFPVSGAQDTTIYYRD